MLACLIHSVVPGGGDATQTERRREAIEMEKSKYVSILITNRISLSCEPKNTKNEEQRLEGGVVDLVSFFRGLGSKSREECTWRAKTIRWALDCCFEVSPSTFVLDSSFSVRNTGKPGKITLKPRKNFQMIYTRIHNPAQSAPRGRVLYAADKRSSVEGGC